MKGATKIDPELMEIGDTYRILSVMFDTEFVATLVEATADEGLTFNHDDETSSTVIAFSDVNDYEFFPVGETITRLAALNTVEANSGDSTTNEEDEVDEIEPGVLASPVDPADIKPDDVIKIQKVDGNVAIGVVKKNEIDDDIRIQTETGLNRYIPLIEIEQIYVLTMTNNPDTKAKDPSDEEPKVLVGDINYLREQDPIQVIDNGQLFVGTVDSISMHNLCVRTDTNVYVYFDFTDDNLEVYLLGEDALSCTESADSTSATSKETVVVNAADQSTTLEVGDKVLVYHDNVNKPTEGVVGLNEFDDDLKLEGELAVRYIDWARIQKVVVDKPNEAPVEVTDTSVEFFELFEKYVQLPAASTKLAEVIHSQMEVLATTVDLIEALSFAVKQRTSIIEKAIKDADEHSASSVDKDLLTDETPSITQGA